MTQTDPLWRPAVRTQLDPPAVVEAFARAYVEVFDRPAHRPAVLLLAAQCLHETAGGVQCFNHNFSGLKAESGYPYCCLGTHELLPTAQADALLAAGKALPPKFPHAPRPGRKAVYLKPDSGLVAVRFRAFASVDEGAWWSTRKYKTPQRYGTEAVAKALESGDPVAFSEAIGALGYYSAERSEYAAAMTKRLAQASALAVDWSAFPIMSERRARQLVGDGTGGLVGLTVQSARRDSERGEGGEGDGNA